MSTLHCVNMSALIVERSRQCLKVGRISIIVSSRFQIKCKYVLMVERSQYCLIVGRISLIVSIGFRSNVNMCFNCLEISTLFESWRNIFNSFCGFQIKCKYLF